MIDILIYGINGKLGREVYLEAISRTDVNVVCGVDKRLVGDFNCPIYNSLSDCVGHFDVIIDFSSPSALSDILSYATENNCAVVLATTGYTVNQQEQILEASKTIPICKSNNFSEGIRAIKEILPTLQKTLKNYDVSIVEAHKKTKKDLPSGTAISLNQTIDGNAEILSIRGGDTPGTHEIIFSGQHERILISHLAFSRKAFARGAIDACIKLQYCKNGLYDIL